MSALIPGVVSSSSAIGKPEVVTVGIALTPPKMVFLAPFIADAEGFFAKQNIQAKFAPMPDGLMTELGVATGQINLASVRVQTQFLQQLKGHRSRPSGPTVPSWTRFVSVLQELLPQPISSEKQLVAQALVVLHIPS